MKIERFKKYRRKDIIIAILVISLIIMGAWGFVGSKAKYRYAASFPAVKGTINYKNGDISVLAVKLQQEDGTYLDSEDFPTSGYTLNTTESYCVRSVEGQGQVTQDVTMSYEDNTLTVTGLKKKGTKCFLYFDGIPAKDVILANNAIDTTRNKNEFTGIFEEDTAGRIFEGPSDDSGEDPTYFFAGANPNNWVKFGKEGASDIYWRIIRVNSDGTVRMIYNGTTIDQTGEGTQIGTSAFNTEYNDNAYVGYMYGAIGSDNYNDTHANINSSAIKQQVDTWYNTNLNKVGVKEHISINAGFCGDRKVSTGTYWNTNYTGNGTGIQATTYGPRARVIGPNGWKSNQSATLKCSQINDLYTVSSASRGNKALTYPIGLITSDEILFAGGFGGTDNTSYWLYTNQFYWVISPSGYGGAGVLYVSPSGNLWGHGVNSLHGIRPVINLRADTKLTGLGTTTEPYVVV